LVHVNRPIVLLPNFCIHLRNPDEKDCIKLNKEKHLKCIIGLNHIDNKKYDVESYLNRHWGKMIDVLCESVDIKVEQVINFDLQLTDCNKPT